MSSLWRWLLLQQYVITNLFGKSPSYNCPLGFYCPRGYNIKPIPCLAGFYLEMDPPRLREISKTAIPHRKTPQICSVNVKSAVNTTTARKAQGRGTSTHIKMDLSAQLDKLTPYLAHQAFSVNEMGPWLLKPHVLLGITARWWQPTPRNAALKRCERKVAQITWLAQCCHLTKCLDNISFKLSVSPASLN